MSKQRHARQYRRQLCVLSGFFFSAVTGAHAPLTRTFIRFWTVSFPVVAYRTWRWWLATAVAFFAVVVLIGFWVAGSHEVQSAIGTPTEIDELVSHDVQSYY
ncbi:hypothetical protein NLK98_26995, partial [Klebsiella pneumoniae]|nr:hypothetical protein [Klebsiella pneumoniae]